MHNFYKYLVALTVCLVATHTSQRGPQIHITIYSLRFISVRKLCSPSYVCWSHSHSHWFFLSGYMHMVVNSSVTPHNRLNGYIERAASVTIYVQSDHVHRPEKRKNKTTTHWGFREYLLPKRVRQKCHIELKVVLLYPWQNATLFALVFAGGYVCGSWDYGIWIEIKLVLFNLGWVRNVRL